MSTDEERVGYLSEDEGAAPIDDADRMDPDDTRTLLADPAVWADPTPARASSSTATGPSSSSARVLVGAVAER